MKERIQNMIDLIKGGKYDPEETHSDYDKLLQEFISNYDKDLLPMMEVLIGLKKDFWYA